MVFEKAKPVCPEPINSFLPSRDLFLQTAFLHHHNLYSNMAAKSLKLMVWERGAGEDVKQLEVLFRFSILHSQGKQSERSLKEKKLFSEEVVFLIFT